MRAPPPIKEGEPEPLGVSRERYPTLLALLNRSESLTESDRELVHNYERALSKEERAAFRRFWAKRSPVTSEERALAEQITAQVELVKASREQCSLL